MKGLVLQDISSLVTELKYIAVLLISMIFLQNEWIYMFAIVYAAVLPISALGYDERAKWKKMEQMLPFTTVQLVGSKYILGYLSTGTAVLLAVFGKGLGVNGIVSSEDLVIIAISFCSALTIEAVQLPLMFWVGVEKGRLLFILITVFSACFLYSVSGILQEAAMAQTGPNILLLFAAAAIISNLISLFVSCKLYHR